MVPGMRALIVIGILATAACGPSVHGDDDTGDDTGDDDAPGPDAGDPGEPAANAAVFAHSESTLYRVDPETFEVTTVGNFVWPSGVFADSMTDIAIDKDGLMIGISYSSVYRVDAGNAETTLLSNDLQGMFNGLSFVPAGQVGFPEGPDVLVGSRNTDGAVFSIDPMTGAVAQVGDMGGSWVSSGDIVSVSGFGTVATVTTAGSLGTDVLARLEPLTFTATPIGDDTGYVDLWGIAFWGDKVFGFAEDGHFVLVNTTTGVATPVETSAPRWWGAAVTTAAPVIN
jgi:hypothetical protein